MEILKVENLKVSTFSPDGENKVIRDLSFSLNESGALAIIGGAGSGKTTIAKAVLGMLDGGLIQVGGRIYFTDRTGAVKNSANGEFMRDTAVFVDKDPSADFDESKSVKRQLEEVFLKNPKPDIRKMRLKYAYDVLKDDFGCDGEKVKSFLHKAIDGINFTSVKKTSPVLSAVLVRGGLDLKYGDAAAEKIARYCCREEESFAEERVKAVAAFVGIENADVLKFKPSKLTMDYLKLASLARALLHKPDLMILDEPISYVGAVDREAVITALKKARELKITLLIFTRSLALSEELADDVCVIYRGARCEWGRTEDVFSSPRHEYTRALVNGGDILSLSPKGDSFGTHGRKAGCPYAYNCAAVKDVCKNKAPVEIHYGENRGVLCWSEYEDCYNKGLITLTSEEVKQSVIVLS